MPQPVNPFLKLQAQPANLKIQPAQQYAPLAVQQNQATQARRRGQQKAVSATASYRQGAPTNADRRLFNPTLGG